MPFNFAQVKAQARQAVHAALAVSALYEDDTVTPAVSVKARWHNKIDRFGDLQGQSYAELIQGIDRIIFEASVARANNMKRGGVVTFPDYGNAQFYLDTREASTGPFEEVWLVTRKAA